jgi:hypothetical protein
MDVAELSLGTGVTSECGPVHNTANVLLDWPSRKVANHRKLPVFSLPENFFPQAKPARPSPAPLISVTYNALFCAI